MSPSPEAMEIELRAKLRTMPEEAQVDIESVARAIRNMLIVGPVARIAVLMVATEITLEGARRIAARGAKP
jgi:hypothetical protein